MTEQLITYELDGDIALIGLNRVAKRNAMHPPMADALVEAAHRANEEARAAVIFGHGEHFCGGLDLVATAKARAAEPADQQKMSRHSAHLGFDCIARAKIPYFSALQGAVIGMGLELAATTHVRVADTTAFFGLPEALRGIFVGGGGSVRIQRLVGYARMADMMLTRRILSADEAREANACQYVVSAGSALDKAKELARIAAENAPLSNWAICNLLPRTNDMGYDDGFFLEQLGASYVFTDESMRRLTAFAEKKVEAFKPKEDIG